jgi:2-phospho-L-lactate guanylyltransferase (CobY/MobA/RfbA family)
VLNCPSIALDIDTPADVARFMSIPSRTNSRALLEDWGMSMQSAAVLQTGQA